MDGYREFPIEVAKDQIGHDLIALKDFMPEQSDKYTAYFHIVYDEWVRIRLAFSDTWEVTFVKRGATADEEVIKIQEVYAFDLRTVFYEIAKAGYAKTNDKIVA